MKKYLFYRLIFIFLTLFCIILVNFSILRSIKIGAFEVATLTLENNPTGAKLDTETLAQLKKHFFLDESAVVQFFKTAVNYLFFDFGKSYFSDKSVSKIILSKMPVSITLGFFSTLLIYMIAVPLGYFKINRLVITSLVVLYIIPSFVLASLSLLIFKNGNMLMAILINSASGLLFMTLLAKNIFLSQKQKTYYIFSQYKGLGAGVLFKNHLLKNFLLIFLSDFSSIFLAILFGSNLFVEILFSLDGIGLLMFESINNKDYPVVLALIYILSFLGLFLRLLNDIFIIKIDKRLKMYEKTL
ncbi:MAG: ABC transporter permease subunit [Alphaproteobacteria bacterium]|jgi:microcin C transport system permease protein|nr:ABC transporter permease subunit [Alphaproteobacteria bacterium]